MSDFLDILGVNLKCAQLSMALSGIGAGNTRSADASMRSNTQKTVWAGHGKTVPMQRADAEFFQALLAKRYDHWAWVSDLYSDKGAAPYASASATVDGAGPYDGALHLGATTGDLKYLNLFRLNMGCTVALLVDTGSGFDSWVLSIGAATVLQGVWKNGVAQATAYPSWIAVNNSGATSGWANVELKNTDAVTYSFAEMMVIGAPASSAQATALSTWLGSNQPPSAPAFTVSGNFCAESLTMRGDGSPSADNLAGNLIDGNGRQSNLRALSFKLIED